MRYVAIGLATVSVVQGSSGIHLATDFVQAPCQPCSNRLTVPVGDQSHPGYSTMPALDNDTWQIGT